MYVVKVRAKGTKGAISVPPRSFNRDPTPQELKDAKQDAIKLYQQVHGQSFHPTVDIQIDKK